MNVLSIPVIITFAVNASLFLFTALSKKRSCVSNWFAVFLFFFVLWNLSVVLALNDVSRVYVTNDILLGFNLIFVLPPLWLVVVDCYDNHLFAARFLDIHVLVFLLLPLAVLALGHLIIQMSFFRFSSNALLFFKLDLYKDWRYYFLLALEIFYFSFGFYLLYRKFKVAKSLFERTGLVYFALGSVIFLWTYFEIVLFSGERSLYFYLLVIFLVPFYFYIFVFGAGNRYLGHTSKINLKHIFYSSILSTFYYLVIYYILTSLNFYFGINSFWIDAFLVFVMIFFIYPLRFPLQQILDSALNKRIEELKRNVLDFMGELYKIYDNAKLLNAAAESIEKNFKVTKVTIFSRQKDKFIATNEFREVGFDINTSVISILEKLRATLELFSIDCQKAGGDACESFKNYGYELFLPVFNNEKLVVILGIKEKLNKHKFNFDEIRLLDLYVNELSSLYSRNAVLAIAKSQEQRKAQMEKLATIGRMTSIVAHEIRNPLNTIKMSAETLIKRKLPPDQQKELQSYILDEAQRLNRILNEFLHFSKLPRPNLICADMVSFIEKVEHYLADKANQFAFRYRVVNRMKNVKFVTDVDLLYQVLINLIDNAAEAILDKQAKLEKFIGDVIVYFYNYAQSLVIVVQDNGIAVREEDKSKIFEPFFTTKIKGTGLGLAITQNIVKSLNGDIILTTKDRKKRFVIKLPEKITENECK